MNQDNYRPSRFQLLPEVVKNLLIINGIMFLATLVLSDEQNTALTRLLALHYFESGYFMPHQFVTHLFMHGGTWHIFSNMLALWMFGSVLENYWGGKRFLIYYFITGLGAALIHSLAQYYEISAFSAQIDAFNSYPTLDTFTGLMKDYVPFMSDSGLNDYDNFMRAWRTSPSEPLLLEQAGRYLNDILMLKMNIPTVGASGAVFGVLLAFGMLFPNTWIYMYFAIPIKAKYFVTIYGLMELYLGFKNNPGDNVAHFAHLGGMLFGFIMIRLWKRNRNYFY
jgi:membrane associated rhomboid family serine protease